MEVISRDQFTVQRCRIIHDPTGTVFTFLDGAKTFAKVDWSRSNGLEHAGRGFRSHQILIGATILLAELSNRAASRAEPARELALS